MQNNLTISDRKYLKRIKGKASESEVAEFKANMRPFLEDYMRVLKFRYQDFKRMMAKPSRDRHYHQWKGQA